MSKSPMTVFLEGSWWKIKSVPARPHCLSLIMCPPLSLSPCSPWTRWSCWPARWRSVRRWLWPGHLWHRWRDQLWTDWGPLQRDKIKGKVQVVHENTTINKPQVILTCVPDRVWLRSSCMSVPLGGCEHQLLTASGKRWCGDFIIWRFAYSPGYLQAFQFYFLTFETQRSSSLLARTAWPLLLDSKQMFPKWRTLATIPNKCCAEWKNSWGDDKLVGESQRFE